MTLPFPKDNGQRKFICFICGKSFDELNSMNEHIGESHDEGRDFIRCPACNFCVRDLRMHYSAKHRDRAVPKTGQLRALIWRDKTKNGGMRTRKPKFREGYFISNKNGGKEFHYRSGWECEVLECLEVINEVNAFDVEPFKGGIPYLFEGQMHHYFPDLSIQFNDGHVEIWEVKPENQTELPINIAKWAAAKQYCDARGWDFIVISETGINKLKKKAKQNKL